MAKTAQRKKPKPRDGGTYVKPGLDDAFILRMDRPILQEALNAMRTIYGGRPEPAEGKWLGFLISLGTEQALLTFGPSSQDSKLPAAAKDDSTAA